MVGTRKFYNYSHFLLIYYLSLFSSVRPIDDDTKDLSRNNKICDCPDVIRPVCGTNNETYTNICALQCAQRKNEDLLFFYNGSCCPQTECTGDERPFCDNFGKTHTNVCHFKRIQCIMMKSMGLSLEKIYDGRCSLKNCTSNCSDEYDPVCDTNGTLYRNLCVFKKLKCELEETAQTIELAIDRKSCYLGRSTTNSFKLKPDFPHPRAAGVESYSAYMDEELPETSTPIVILPETTIKIINDMSTTTLKPEITYVTRGSSSTSSQKRTTHGYTGTYINQECNLADCDKNWNPVCDTSNRTHKNICHFKYYACKVNRIDGSLIEILHAGSCKTRKTTCISCPKDEKPIPVCDNKNTTHPNLCSFIQHNCFARNSDEEESVLVHIKACHERSPQFKQKDEVCPKKCSRDLKPVCDEANNTHQNLCHFQQYNCNMRKLGIQSPHLRYLRPCVKNRREDTAVEKIEVSAAVSNVEMETSSTPTKSTVSEKTTFIISDIEIRYPANPKKSSTTKSVITSTTKNPPESAEKNNKNTTVVPTTAPTVTKSDITILENITTAGINDTTTLSSDIAFFDCPKPNCPTDGQPVCDSEGNLHGNLCEFTYSRCLAARKGVQLHISTEELCVSAEACQMPCTDEKHPICGSDFSTYDNLCQFRKQKCLDQDLEVLFKGKCNECLDSPCAHPAFDAPDDSFVCVEDDSTKSLCEYQMLSCIFERGYGVNLTVQYIGKCCPRIETCDEEPADPICASNGVTFLTECEMNIENCKNAKLEITLLSVVKKGVCEKDLITSFGDDSLSKISPFETKNIDIEFKRENKFNCSVECDKSYDPLCGTNGITYTNACSLQKEICDSKNSTIEIAYAGMCCDKNCPNDFSPVCDSKGNTNQNICHFGYRRCISERTSGDVLTIEKFGICNEVKECEMNCPKEYVPVCASNNQNIINECELNHINCLIRNNITMGEPMEKDYDGECCKDENCDVTTFSPVCDSDGITHANECLMRKHACVQIRKSKKIVTIAHTGQCCNQPCANEVSPVCDGTKTYENVCKFRIAQCEADRKNQTISIEYSGECCAVPDNDCKTSGPVCDSEGQTHANHCLYQQKRCVAQKTNERTLNVVHTGECCALASCPKTGQPVCDSMGRTHDSACHFHNSKCIFDKVHSQNTTLNLDYQGKCCPAGCTDELAVTCDQHGNIYRNTCYFNFRACETWRRTQDVLLVHPCPLLRQ